jgi:cytochrome b6-f complex iron-sulfur subunit
MQRRRFLGKIAGIALPLSIVSLANGCASLVTRRVRATDGALRLSLTHYPELTERNGRLRVLPEGTADPIYIFALEDRRFIALSSVCTHLMCTVELQGQLLVCPCHGSTYDRSGAVVRGPAEAPLSRFGTELTPDGTLVVQLRGAT